MATVVGDGVFVKRELVATVRREDEEEEAHGRTERRALRSSYLEVKNLISDERDDIANMESDMFSSIISRVECLHNLVQKPREQVADAEALLDIAATLVTSVKAHRNDGMTPSDFVTALLKKFSQQDMPTISHNACPNISWSSVGIDVSHIFKSAPGCCTMLGSMTLEPKQRKASISRRRRTPVGVATRPEMVEESEAAKRTDTDKNMSTMFDVLRNHRIVKLEDLVLNRLSFAQTVENIFALSFLVKDGRVEIKVNDKGQHILSPRNAPRAADVSSGQTSFSHFVLRFDFMDWKLMLDTVSPGDELMPHRMAMASGPSFSQATRAHEETQPDASQPTPVMPIWKLCRNRGLVMQEESATGKHEAQDADDLDEIGRKKRKTLIED